MCEIHTFVGHFVYLLMKKLLYIFAIVSLFTACSDDIPDGPPQLELYIEDSPAAEIQSVNVVIEDIELFGADKWSKLNYNKRTIPIMEYTGGKSLKLVTQPLTEGSYSKIRFTFAAEGNNLTTTGKRGELTIAAENRIVELPLTLETTQGMVYIMCDMDVAASVDTTTMSLNPKLSIIDLNTAGAISGVIATTEGVKIAEAMLVECISERQKIKSSYTNASSGEFFVRLDADTYTVIITPNKTSRFKPDTLRNIVVEQAKATMVGAVQLTAIPTPEGGEEE